MANWGQNYNGAANTSAGTATGSAPHGTASYYFFLNSLAIDLMLAREYEKAMYHLNVGIASLDQHSSIADDGDDDSVDQDSDNDDFDDGDFDDVKTKSNTNEDGDCNGKGDSSTAESIGTATTTTTVAPVPMYLPISPSPATSPYSMYCKAFSIWAVPCTIPTSEDSEETMSVEQQDCGCRRDALLSRRDCRLVFSVLLYNLGLCHQLAFLTRFKRGGRQMEHHLHRSLAAYQMAIACSYTDDDPSFLLFELSVLNNSCHIHGHFNDHEQLPKCLEQMECIMNTIEADRSCDVIPSQELSVFQRTMVSASQTYDCMEVA